VSGETGEVHPQPVETVERRRLLRHGKGGVKERRARALLRRPKRARSDAASRRSLPHVAVLVNSLGDSHPSTAAPRRHGRCLISRGGVGKSPTTMADATPAPTAARGINLAGAPVVEQIDNELPSPRLMRQPRMIASVSPPSIRPPEWTKTEHLGWPIECSGSAETKRELHGRVADTRSSCRPASVGERRAWPLRWA
jgi:hypothetical protein